MRHIFSFAFAVFAVATAFNAFAAGDEHKTCPFLSHEDFGAQGVTKDTAFSDSDWAWGDTPKETPFAKVVTNLCTINMKSKMGSSSIIFAVDRFDGKVTEDEVSSWIKAIDSRKDEDEEITVVTLGNVTCETGSYELPTTLDEGAKNVNELYVACNTQVGTRHVSLNFHFPEEQKEKLPSPEQAKAILDNSVKRLKEGNRI